jgi:hypothetical protein
MGERHFNKGLYTNKVMGGKGILTRVYTQIKSWGERHFNKGLYTNKVMGEKAF